MTLRARVLDGQIDAGPGLTESDVAAKHDVSRPTAKTAISLLVHEGAAAPRGPQVGLRPQVVPQRRRGPLPRPYPPGVGGRPAREGQQAVLAAATRAVEDLAALPAGVAHSKFVVANRRFHHARVEAVDSPRLTRLYAGLRGEIHVSMVQTHYGVGVTASSPNTAPSWTSWTLPNQTRPRHACAATSKEPAMPSQNNSTPSPTAPRPPDTRRTSDPNNPSGRQPGGNTGCHRRRPPVGDFSAPLIVRRTQPLRTPPSCSAQPPLAPVVTAISPPISAHSVSGVTDRAQSLAVSCGSR